MPPLGVPTLGNRADTLGVGPKTNSNFPLVMSVPSIMATSDNLKLVRKSKLSGLLPANASSSGLSVSGLIVSVDLTNTDVTNPRDR